MTSLPGAEVIDTGETRTRVRSAHGKRGARTYNGGMGRRDTARSRGKAPLKGSGADNPPEAERLFAFSQPEKS